MSTKPFGHFQPDPDAGPGCYKCGIYTIVRQGTLWVVFGHGWHKPDRIGSFRTLREAHFHLTGGPP